MKNKLLDKLIDVGSIKSYNYVNLNDNEEVCEEQTGSRNTEKLVITFNDDNKLEINSFCSGSVQNTTLFFNIM